MTLRRVGDRESAKLMTGRGGPFHAFVQHFNFFSDFLYQYHFYFGTAK